MSNSDQPKVTVTKSGVRQVSPKDILRSDVGRQVLREMHKVMERSVKMNGSAPKSR